MVTFVGFVLSRQGILMRRLAVEMQVGKVQKPVPVLRQNVVLAGVRLEPDVVEDGHVERRRLETFPERRS